jgi:hypothetical protein
MIDKALELKKKGEKKDEQSTLKKRNQKTPKRQDLKSKRLKMRATHNTLSS